MVSLNLERINSNSPYAVTALRDSMCFRFVTDFGVIYYVSFLEDELMLSDESYQFIIANTNNVFITIEQPKLIRNIRV